MFQLVVDGDEGLLNEAFARSDFKARAAGRAVAAFGGGFYGGDVAVVVVAVGDNPRCFGRAVGFEVEAEFDKGFTGNCDHGVALADGENVEFDRNFFGRVKTVGTAGHK